MKKITFLFLLLGSILSSCQNEFVFDLYKDTIDPIPIEVYQFKDKFEYVIDAYNVTVESASFDNQNSYELKSLDRAYEDMYPEACLVLRSFGTMEDEFRIGSKDDTAMIVTAAALCAYSVSDKIANTALMRTKGEGPNDVYHYASVVFSCMLNALGLNSITVANAAETLGYKLSEEIAKKWWSKKTIVELAEILVTKVAPKTVPAVGWAVFGAEVIICTLSSN